jgi:hypothetical protein
MAARAEIDCAYGRNPANERAARRARRLSSCLHTFRSLPGPPMR